MTDGSTYRVVQWATGNIGSRSLRAVIEHPGLSLAGLWVSTQDKVGRDAGSLCGLGPTGITATSDLDEILALGPDCVLYMQQGSDLEVLCALLESGANVVTTAGDFHHIVLGIIVMSLFVVVINRVFWRPLYRYAERNFRLA